MVLIFVSKGYFTSKNVRAPPIMPHQTVLLIHGLCYHLQCLREARCTVEQQKPIALAHDSAVYLKSYMPFETIRDNECPNDLRGAIFYGREVVAWHRIKVHAAVAALVAPVAW